MLVQSDAKAAAAAHRLDAARAGDVSGAIAGGAVFSISELCREFDVTPRTLRFYEAKGLLHPTREGQRRRFSARDRARLKLILRGKRFGFSLAVIARLLDLYDTDDDQNTQLSATLSYARAQLKELRHQRLELEQIIQELEEQVAVVAAMLGEKRD